MRVNDLNDLEEVVFEECVGYQGFFLHPDNKSIAINVNGIVINAKTGDVLKTFLDKKGRFLVNISKKLNPVTNKAQNAKLHRILARTFIGRPSRHKHTSFSKLEVNHIDGNRLNNSISNLEWVTGKENIIHSHLMNLHPNDRRVLAKSLKDGSIVAFNSVFACAKHFNISKPTLWKHLVTGNSGKFHREGYVFKFDDNTQWKHYHASEIRLLGEANKLVDFLISHKENDIKIITQGYESLYQYTKMSTPTLCRRFKKSNILTINNYTIVRL